MSAWPVFLGITVVLCGFAAFATGRALAGTWRPMWWTVPYGLLLALVDRFLQWSLFGGELLSPTAYAADAAVLVGIALLAYRVTQAERMVRQYPWLYARSGLLSWRSVGSGDGGAAQPTETEKN
jgi:branched-chain amino acid transport system ATP-binding protein